MGDIPWDEMIKRLLFVTVSFLVVTGWAQKALGQKSLGQVLQMQSAPASSAQDQTAAPQPTPTPVANELKPAAQPARRPHRSTVGDTASSVPLTMQGKFRYFAVESFRPGVYPVAALYTAYTMANPPNAYPPKWRDGFPAFARNYGDFMASWVSVQGGKFVVASLVHEDPRYFASDSKNFFARSFNAIRYVVVDRSDQGHPRLALANIAGALAGGFVGNAYLPAPYANESHGLSRSALALSGFATSNLADEFWPELMKAARKLHLPFASR
jgi:hypothetical protein